jgi:hypothetical protein
VRGPINAPRSPQGRVPICQAGGSPRGQAFASRWADTIITNALTVEAMKKFRAEVRQRAVGWGRDPDSIKVLYPRLSDRRHHDRGGAERRRCWRRRTAAISTSTCRACRG